MRERPPTIAGVDGIHVWHDQALVKPSYGNPTGWHLDVPFWSFDSPDAISIWIALDDATVENGCLWYLPGAHREARYELTPIGENLAPSSGNTPPGSSSSPCPQPAAQAMRSFTTASWLMERAPT